MWVGCQTGLIGYGPDPFGRECEGSIQAVDHLGVECKDKARLEGVLDVERATPQKWCPVLLANTHVASQCKLWQPWCKSDSETRRDFHPMVVRARHAQHVLPLHLGGFPYGDKEEGLTAHADDTWVLGALPERASHKLSDEGGHANNSGADYVGEVLRSRRRYSEDSVGVQRHLISRRHGSARLPGATARTPRCYWLGRGHCHCSARLYAAATWRCPGSHG